MTEKQFYIKCDDFNAWNVWENGKDVIVFDLYKSAAQLVCDKLNELSDENEQLKQFKEQHIEEYLKLKTVSNELKRENEQLKQQRDFYYARLQKIIKVANGDVE